MQTIISSQLPKPGKPGICPRLPCFILYLHGIAPLPDIPVVPMQVLLVRETHRVLTSRHACMTFFPLVRTSGKVTV